MSQLHFEFHLFLSMTSENPYAAPQSSISVSSALEESENTEGDSPEWQALADGTRLCLSAVWIALASVGVFLVGRIMKLGLMADIWLLGFLGTAAVRHYWGMYKLLEANNASRFQGLIRVSLISFVIVMLSYFIEFFVTWNRELGMGPLFRLTRMMLWLLTTVSLARGLNRLSTWCHHKLAQWTSEVAFVIFLLTYGILVLFHFAKLLLSDNAWMSSWPDQDLRLVAIVLNVFWIGIWSFGFANYARTLWNLHELAKE
jgi:hypothetical protein